MEKLCSIYIHIPFCKSKCYYCDFNSFANCDNEYINEYFRCLKKEIQMWVPKLKDYVIKTIFIGGGTPSFVDASYIYQILEVLYTNLNISNDAEVTIETNPGTLNRRKLSIFRDANINRISMGLQSTKDEILAKIGRIHTYDEFVQNYNLARNLGFNNINVDLMFGIPFQTYNDWRDTLHEIVNINPEHVSAYSLTIEPNTAFGKLYKQGKLSYIDDEIDRKMYHYAVDFLDRYSYNQYEISNFAKPKRTSKHNRVYWELGGYIGFGASAHSYFEEKRYNNIYDVTEYIKRVQQHQDIKENVEDISTNRKISDYMILGLRLTDGVSKAQFRKLFLTDMDNLFKDKLQNLERKGLIINSNANVTLTKQGKDLANLVFMEFLN